MIPLQPRYATDDRAEEEVDEVCGEHDHDMERIAEQAGFSSTRQLRRAWQKIHKRPPREARRHSQRQGRASR